MLKIRKFGARKLTDKRIEGAAGQSNTQAARNALSGMELEKTKRPRSALSYRAEERMRNIKAGGPGMFRKPKKPSER